MHSYHGSLLLQGNEMITNLELSCEILALIFCCENCIIYNVTRGEELNGIWSKICLILSRWPTVLYITFSHSLLTIYDQTRLLLIN